MLTLIDKGRATQGLLVADKAGENVFLPIFTGSAVLENSVPVL